MAHLEICLLGTYQILRDAVAVTGFALETGTAVLAEGIETDRQLAVVKALGFSLGQGYLLGRPTPLPSPPPESA